MSDRSTSSKPLCDSEDKEWKCSTPMGQPTPPLDSGNLSPMALDSMNERKENSGVESEVTESKEAVASSCIDQETTGSEAQNVAGPSEESTKKTNESLPSVEEILADFREVSQTQDRFMCSSPKSDCLHAAPKFDARLPSILPSSDSSYSGKDDNAIEFESDSESEIPKLEPTFLVITLSSDSEDEELEPGCEIESMEFNRREDDFGSMDMEANGDDAAEEQALKEAAKRELQDAIMNLMTTENLGPENMEEENSAPNQYANVTDAEMLDIEDIVGGNPVPLHMSNICPITVPGGAGVEACDDTIQFVGGPVVNVQGRNDNFTAPGSSKEEKEE